MDKSKFLGETKGNRDLHCNVSGMEKGGSGESHEGSPSGKFLGPTNGNTNLPPDRTSGTGGGAGGKFTAGGPN
jgi:hypothetical protein